MDQSETMFLSHNQNQIRNIVVLLNIMLLFGNFAVDDKQKYAIRFDHL